MTDHRADPYAHAGAATDLAAASNQLNPRQRANLTTSEFRRLYQPRGNQRQLKSLLKRLRNAVRPDGAPLQALYLGPSGCGKSMDLAWLVDAIHGDAQLHRALAPLHFSINQVVGLHQVGFVELALALALQLQSAAPEDIPEARLDDVLRWIYGSQTDELLEQTSMSAGLAPSVAGLVAGALRAKVTREAVKRVELGRRLPQLVELLNGLVMTFKEAKGKAPLFIVDDLEKITPVDHALALFLNEGSFCDDLRCHLIFTAPNALTLHERYTTEVLGHFQELRTVLTYPGTEAAMEDEADALRHIVYRRVAPFLIDPAALDHAIVQTGGVVAQLVEVMQSAALETELDEASRVGINQVDAGLKVLKRRYSSMLKDDDYAVLERLTLGDRHALPSEVKHPSLLHNLAVLEYPNDPSWVAVHPLVKPLVQRWRRAQGELPASQGR